ncbi:membrane protease YdiL (CAAX protease family) [Allocatelliglobosispora scoriae]|uniref:Membrane protease YdiL (CAAX protease family) n=1 Tax=Allocatelliglobosispora scoriae TaxID=643052 RepID=A0A841C512_9ACTN|nr:CPBP family intramembrane glutamic endopeptidase [Allocatelliglobosispora scoriae]MBB5874233.1 membrane protease YdiL (CAAX protease family) [Allocatelliglobosispora scoriae]
MRAAIARLRLLLAPSLIDMVPRDHAQTGAAFRRRRVVVVVTLVLGAVLLGVSLSTQPGDSSFYLRTIVLALTWAVGGLLSGPLHLGYLTFRGGLRRPLITPVATGLLIGGVFLVGALVVREIPPLNAYVVDVLDHAYQGDMVPIATVTVINAVAEEIFFRGALFAAIGRVHPVLISTVIYALVTIATGNPMLVFAAVTLGFVLALQRRSSGGILAPILTHVTWSLVMLFALTPLFD